MTIMTLALTQHAAHAMTMPIVTMAA